MPSFYGGASWTAWLALYLLRLLDWNQPRPASVAVFAAVASCFLVSTVAFYSQYTHAYRGILEDRREGRREVLSTSTQFVAGLHAAGFIGLALFWYSTGNKLGGLNEATRLLAQDPSQIRFATMTSNMPGVELTYLGWVAIFLTVIRTTQRRVAWGWLALAGAQFAGNFLFIDRTRPAWIIAVSFLLFLLLWRPSHMKRVAWLGGALGVVLLFLFLAIARWAGRFGAGGMAGDTALPYWAQNLYSYGTGGFAYFNDVFRPSALDIGLPERTMAPVFKVLDLLGLAEGPPPEVLEFRDVPFATNVGTFLEPFYQDGGVVYMAVGIVLYSVGWNLVGVICMKARDSMCAILWANLCFMTAIGFFVPKAGATAIWLFAIMAAISVGARELGWLSSRRLDLGDAT